MQSHSTTLTIKVLLIEEDDGRWSAQCLEHDIVAQANKLSELDYEFDKVLVAYAMLSAAAGEEPFADLNRAPQEFWDMYEDAVMEVHVSKHKIPRATPAQYPVPKPYFRVAESVSA